MRILCRTPILRPQLAALARAAGVEIVCPEDAEATLREAAAADVLWLWPAFYDRTLAAALGSSGRLRWIQLLTMGYDPLEAFGAPAGVTITNAGDAYAPTVAEHALTMLLALLRQIPAALERGAAHTWDNPGISAGVRTLIGARVAVIGFGSIGREVAARLRACGGCVIAVSQSGRAHALADECANVGDLHAVLATCDAVVVAVPLTSATRNLIDGAALAALPARAVLINVARGAVVDSAALGAALREGRLAGAGLDVTEPEPLPAGDPLWDAPNLIVTPHIAGYGGAVPAQRLGGLLQRNLDAFLNGRPLEAQITLRPHASAQPAAAATLLSPQQ